MVLECRKKDERAIILVTGNAITNDFFSTRCSSFDRLADLLQNRLHLWWISFNILVNCRCDWSFFFHWPVIFLKQFSDSANPSPDFYQAYSEITASLGSSGISFCCKNPTVILFGWLKPGRNRTWAWPHLALAE